MGDLHRYMGLARKFGLFFIIISRSICTFMVVGGGKLAPVVGLNFILCTKHDPKTILLLNFSCTFRFMFHRKKELKMVFYLN